MRATATASPKRPHSPATSTIWRLPAPASCAGFLRLTRFWLEKYSANVFDLRYEALLADPERIIPQLLDFCGLPFDPACLEPHKTSRAVLTPSAAQVRQPLRSNTARSARYGDKLEHLRQRLRDAGVQLE